MRRTQIYLDDTQTSRLDRRAAEKGVTRSKVIRLAIDEFLLNEDGDDAAWREQWKRVVDETAGAAPGLAPGAGYVEDLRRIDADRLSEFTS
jgi:predicted transcriptional regulator